MHLKENHSSKSLNFSFSFFSFFDIKGMVKVVKLIHCSQALIK